MRAVSVRVVVSTSGNRASIVPANVSPKCRHSCYDYGARRQATTLRFRDRGVDPDVVETVDAHQWHARGDRRTVAHIEFADDTGAGRGQGDSRLCLAAALDRTNLSITDAEQHEPLSCSRTQRVESWRSRTTQGEIFLLCRRPVRCEHRQQGLAGCNLSQRRTHMQLFDDAGDAALHDADRALVERDRARCAHAGFQCAFFGLCGTHAKVLRQAWIDRYGTWLSTRATRVFRHQLHVHERRFAGCIEMLVGHHRVVPVQRFLGGRRRRWCQRRGAVVHPQQRCGNA